MDAPRAEASEYAPRMVKMKISVGKIRDVIGKGGSVIRGITESTNTKIDVAEDGTITINGKSSESCAKAQEMIKSLTAELEIGAIYDGKVEKILDNVGAIVSILPGKDGLLHISQISEERVQNVSQHLSVGQSLRVRVIQSEEGRVRLSIRNMQQA